MEEIWKDIKNYEGIYQVSNLGRVKNIIKGNILSLNRHNGNGYLLCTLCKDKVKKNHYFHRLVAEAFCENKQSYNIVNHIDSNVKNNKSNNLEWISQKQNIYHCIKLNRKWDYGCNSPNSSLTESEVIEIYKLSNRTDITQDEIAKLYNINQITVSRIKRKITYNKLLSNVD